MVKSHPVAAPVPELAEVDSPPPAEAAAAAAANPGQPPAFFVPAAEMPRSPGIAPPAPVRHQARHGEDGTVERPTADPPRDPQAGGNGNTARPLTPAGSPPLNGEPRRTLHLSLGGSDAGHRHDQQPYVAPGPAAPSAGERAAPQRVAAPSAGQTSRPGMGQYPPSGNGAPLPAAAEMPSAKEGSTFIDRVLRARVDGDIAAFLAAFDAALESDTVESRTHLREATDRLLRAGARTRIELERLEARVPLVPRDKSGLEARASRPR